jgi:Transposase DDE domain
VAVDGDATKITADAAYDTLAIYKAAEVRGAEVVVPPAKTAKVSRHGPRLEARDSTIERIAEIGRREWKKKSGYHQQGRVENTILRWKSILGDRLRARCGEGMTVEAAIGCNTLNRLTELGRPVAVASGA